jgi:hypothetical protein
MIAPFTIALGVALGMRFKVNILFPVQALAIMSVYSAFHSESGYTIFYYSVLVCICLQAGYISGIFSRYLRVMGRRRRRQGASLDPESISELGR